MRRYLWGGRRLETVLGKRLPPGDDYAESWEIVDHGDDQSVVLAGPLAGQTLGELVRRNAADLFGRHAPERGFPLLLKFLDCQRTLSLQVHPNDAQASRLTPPDLGKTEAWVVLAAAPGARIYSGLAEGVSRASLAEAIRASASIPAELSETAAPLVRLLHSFEPAVGDCVFIPAGTVHALGAGLLMAEIQQASDTTFRLFDWNRVDATGRPRPLHVDESLAVIDFDRGPVDAQRPNSIAPGRERLVECDKFVLDRCELTSPITVGGDNRFHILATIAGEVSAEGDPTGAPLVTGRSALLPAAAGLLKLTPHGAATLLDVYLP
jgi:mannose-6-phosphate isomerase